MKPRADTAPGRLGDGASARTPAAEDHGNRPPKGPLALVVASLWAGLVVGFVELALFLARVQLSQHGLFRKSPHVLWMIPVADLAIFGVIGLFLTILVRPIPKVGARLSAWLLCTVALTTPLLAVPGLWAICSLLLAAGLACWIAPAIHNRGRGFRRLVRVSLPPLGLALLALVGITIGRDRIVSRGGLTHGTASPGAPNVLLIVMDTVRADATNLNGSARDTTPNLASLAAQGARFERAIATSPWTLASHASMFTGRWPWELSVGPDRALDAHHPTLAEHLGRQGYATAGFAANTVFCTTEYGLSRGFGHYEDFVISPLETLRSSALGWLICRRLVAPLDHLWTAAGREASHPLELSYHRKDAGEINRAALTWIAKQSDRPFFAFLNYLDAHDPYLVPGPAERPFSRRRATLSERRALRDWIGETPRKRTPAELRLARDSYDDCLAYLDSQIGRLIAELDRLDRLKDTVIVVTSDHGEHFGEHDRDGYPIVGHRQSVYQPEIHVPLIVVAPKQVPARTVVSEAVSLRDLPATIVALVGDQSRSPFPGRSLLPPSSAEDKPAPNRAVESAALAEFSPDQEQPVSLRYQPGATSLMRAVVTDDKVYHRHGNGQEEYYNLREDPSESINLAPSQLARGPLNQFRATLNRLTPTK
ncbi:sulfatase [Singulisphaera acidiphila]|uniref:Arylsulfatase A family protein n=1 Tax=Singulisphaera acidiphila (strain ATCC BAA-1392 / DSM 18658 / VKM B-2454 / MOB10) TaxID=886293 RepID=L0D9A0_SINAD|nr:sulfatase [Singulisphaera acidiphila]AGA25964.1 arylsulfatase A family protein [Singulisphaera acidiphila DSM 18658]